MVFDLVDMNPDNALFGVPRLNDLVFDPLPACSLGSDQYDRARLSLELSCNPLLDGGVAAALNRLPVVVGNGRVAFDGTDVADLPRSPAVWLVVKTEKDLPSNAGILRQGLDPLREARSKGSRGTR